MALIQPILQVAAAPVACHFYQIFLVRQGGGLPPPFLNRVNLPSSGVEVIQQHVEFKEKNPKLIEFPSLSRQHRISTVDLEIAMSLFIQECDIGQIDFANINVVLIGRPGDIAGVPVWESRRLPPFCHADAEAPMWPTERVMIAVEDPDDHPTIERMIQVVAGARENWRRTCRQGVRSRLSYRS